MPEAPGQEPVDKRATWVALRTVRQRPKIVDHQKNGDPIYEIRSIRLILRENVDHFNRLTQCSKCGREVPGAPVLTQADLTRPSHTVLCKECVRKATDRSQRSREAKRDEVGPPAPQVPHGDAPVAGPPARNGVDGGGLAAVESRLADVLTRLDALAATQNQERTERREAVEAVQSRMQTALSEGLDDRWSQTVSSAGDGHPLVAALEGRVRKSLAALVEVTQSQRSDLGALTEALAETRSDLRRVAESNQELAQDADRRLAEITTFLHAQPASAALLEALRGEIAEVESRLAGSVASQRAELQVALTEGLASARHEVASLEEQLRSSADALTQFVEAQRGEVGNAPSERMEQQLATLAEAVRQLTNARDELEGKVGSLLEHALETEARMHALASSADAGGIRLHALEQSISEALSRLTALVEEERRLRGAEAEAEARELARRTWDEGSTAPPADGPSMSGSLLDALDRQLHEAERRLARHLSSGRSV